MLNLDNLAEVTGEFGRLCSTAQSLSVSHSTNSAAALMRHALHAMEQARRLADVKSRLSDEQHRPTRWSV
ncbi:hypothetical protein ACFOD4_10790 [Pseudoroseomonas globiformis]|uniref:Uncharacterized protein n=1 Tax=Teichococcus globiformis TaxID=2307229 RepID=A0ABV7FZB1_9PROT